MEVDAGGRLDQPAAEAGGVGLDERHGQPVPVHHAQVGGVARPRRRASPPNRYRFGGYGVSTWGDARRVDEGGAVRGLVQDVGPVVTGGHGGLDEQVRPPGVVGIVRQREPLRDPRSGQGQVALGARRDGPQPVTPRVQPQRLDPVRLAAGQIIGREVPATYGQETVPELALVEGAPSALADGAQRPGRARPADRCARARRLSGQLLQPDAGRLVDRGQRTDEERRRREAVLGQRDGGGQHVGQREPAVACVERGPPVDAAGDRDRSDVVAQRHLGVPLGRQRAGIGAAPGPARRVERHGRGAGRRGRARRGRHRGRRDAVP